ncbi:hypothetical protein ACFO4E_10765 [Nocardiopsis mangrovi]|uniref:WXG100 family type VII secretion target n=1 Tax=Nocardiopsis mangrovi TaxID=1179818 RepID=A0ABV9DUG5_9ACTN
MTTGRTAMETAHAECNEVYTKVDFLRDSLKSSWQGGAEAGYETALVKWLEELRLIVNGMNQMIGTFGGTTRGMLNLEDDNLVISSSWNDQLNPNQSGYAVQGELLGPGRS